MSVRIFLDFLCNLINISVVTKINVFLWLVKILLDDDSFKRATNLAPV